MNPPTITIDGNNFHDISSFYEEMNLIFMSEQDWKMGQSLDALNDVFHGGFGPIRGDEPVVILWKNFDKSMRDLGYDVMHAHLTAKLSRPETYNLAKITQDLIELERTGHPTYMEQILEIIADHPNITLITM